MDNTFDLHDGHWRVLVAPSLGGSLLSCEYDGEPVLQPTVQPESTPLFSTLNTITGCFELAAGLTA